MSPVQAQSVDANDVPVEARWSITVTEISSIPGRDQDRRYTFLAGAELSATVEVKATFGGREVPVDDATIIVLLGDQPVQAVTDTSGQAAVRLVTDMPPGRYPVLAVLASGNVDATTPRMVTLYDYIVEMPTGLQVHSSGASSGFVDAVLRRRQPDRGGTLQFLEPGDRLADDMQSVRFLAPPELELIGTGNQNADPRIYGTMPAGDGRMTFQVRSETEGDYTVRAVGIGARYRLIDGTLGETTVSVRDQAEGIWLEFGSSMDGFFVGPDRIEIPNIDMDDDKRIDLEVLALRDGVPGEGIEIQVSRAPGAEITVADGFTTSFIVDASEVVQVSRPGVGPQTVSIRAVEGSNTLTAVIVGVEDEEPAECPPSMLEIAARQGGVEICGTGRPDPARAPHPYDGIWQVSPGETLDSNLIAFLRQNQSAEFASAGRRMAVLVGSPADNPEFPRRMRADLSVPGGLSLESSSGVAWLLDATGNTERLEGTWIGNSGERELTAVARRLFAEPSVRDISVSVFRPDDLFAQNPHRTDHLQPPFVRGVRLPVAATDAPMCSGPFVSHWVSLQGDGFAGGHDVWIDPASFLEISPQSGWVCSNRQRTAIDRGAGEGWGNCTLGAEGAVQDTVQGLDIGLCPRPGIQPGPVDLWVNGQAIRFQIEVFDSVAAIIAADNN